MIIVTDEVSARDALNQPLSSDVRNLIVAHWQRATARGLTDQTVIAVVQPGDSEAMLINELGWSPLADPVAGCRFEELGFQPYWSWLADLGGCFELILTVGNAGFAFILLIPKAEGVLPDLLAMCGRYAGEGH
jgi:hypothetical protein